MHHQVRRGSLFDAHHCNTLQHTTTHCNMYTFIHAHIHRQRCTGKCGEDRCLMWISGSIPMKSFSTPSGTLPLQGTSPLVVHGTYMWIFLCVRVRMCVCKMLLYTLVDIAIIGGFSRVAAHGMNVYTNTLQPLRHTATHCNTLQHTATHCNTLRTACIYIRLHIYVYMHIHFCLYVYMCLYETLRLYTYVCTCIQYNYTMYVHIHIHFCHDV